MEIFKSLSRYDIEQSLTADQVRITQIILVALFASTILFLIPISVINSTKAYPIVTPGISDFAQLYMYFVIVFAAAAYIFIYFFPALFLTIPAITKRLQTAGAQENKRQAASYLINMDRQFRIIQNAILEGVSLFAIVGIFLELTQSEYQIAGDIWLLTIPIAIHAFILFSNFPTKENILNRIDKDILEKINPHSAY